MKRTDMRRLNPESQAEKRKTAIRMHQSGHTYFEIARILEVHFDTVGVWVRKWKKSGSKALKTQRLGRPIGVGRKLSSEDEKELRRIVIKKKPGDFSIPIELWTRRAVRALIQQKHGVSLSEVSVGTYLRRWGLSPQKPKKKAKEQVARKVDSWVEKEYPEISSEAYSIGAGVYWCDETGISNNIHRGRSYAPIGKTPSISLPARKRSLGLISAIGNEGNLRFSCFTGAMNSSKFIRFLRALTKDATVPIFLILDNLRVHHSSQVRDWIDRNSEKISVFYLPPYCPELNPDEYLNSHLKSVVYQGAVASSQEELKARLHRWMLSLQKKKDIVKSYFKHPVAQYAA